MIFFSANETFLYSMEKGRERAKQWRPRERERERERDSVAAEGLRHGQYT
jgi:hypothetical protein